MAEEVQIPNEIKDEIVRQAYHRIEEQEASGTPAPQILVDVGAWLLTHREVEAIHTFRDSDLTVRFADDTQVGILLQRQEKYGVPKAPPRRRRKRTKAEGQG